MNPKPKGYFITGTDTEIGKTYSSVSLIQHLVNCGQKIAALKPVASGCEKTAEGFRNSDALQLSQAANVALPYDKVNRYAFEPAIAPHIAAKQSGIKIELNKIHHDLCCAQSHADMVVVEAAGGWLVPLNDTQSISNLAQLLSLPVILVVGIRLGCINHALLTLNNIEQSGVTIAGWVANRIDEHTQHADEQIASIKARTPIPCIADIPNKNSGSSAIKWHLEC